MIKHFVAISAIAACISNPAAAQTSFGSAEQLPSFEVKDGDRVIFLGSEFTERRTKFNYFEAELAARWPDRRVSFFNLGWSGDTPSGIARGYFGGADEGFKRLIDEVERIKPTIVFLNYGSNLEGKTTEQFARNYTRLYDKLKEFTPRVIAMTPPPVEARPAPWPSAINLNAKRRAAARFIRVIVTSDTTGSPFFVNLFAAFERRLRKPVQPITADGLRFTDQGYEMVADIMLRSLRVQDTPARTKLTSEKFDTLRSMIAEKNRLYFHRYRPQNETYLRGFRKHEQGQNAKEIAEFDALITQAENRIYALLNDQPLPAPIKEPEPIELSFTALDPEAQREQFTVADGLKVSLFAAEPLIKNPIHMNFDGQGRLWVATSPIYPQIKPGAKPRDEIVILEDTDNDGVADKRTVFADDLLIPTAVLPDERGGAFVANSTELLHLSDTDGDGKADQRRVIFAGFGTEDTHHILHTFRWGPDAAMYFNQSIYIHTHMETSTGVKRLMGSGIWRYNPKTGTADVMMRGLVNPWGHIFDDYGQSFATDGAGGNGINYAFPGSAYATAVGFPRVLTGLNPGQPKMCGLEIITGSHWPEDWQGTLVTNDFRGNRINRFKLSDEGSSYVSTQMPDVLTSRHRAFRPVDLKLGPDGSLFVADWYNPIINHGEVDFRDSRRDYKHGRIWRVEVADRPRTEPPQLAGASVEELLEMLKLPEQRTRHMARLELSKRRGFAVSLGLGTFVRSIPEDNYDLMLEALWTFESLGKMNAKLLEKVFNAPSHQHRAAAVRIVSHMGDRVDPAGKYVTAAVADEHPRVRLEALAALRARPSPKAADLAMSILEMPMDKNLDFALWFT
ncbi:MAG: PVC-type heme-binding CxxCH protein, partial [Planctomycetaceae bacterium]